MTSLQDKAVVVTGAGRGIGAGIARYAAAEGAAVVVNDVDADVAAASAQAIVAAGGRAVAHAADVSQPAAAEALIARCEEAFGRIDGLVNNAGLFDVAKFEDETAEQLQRILAVNVVGPFNCAQAAIRRMYAQGSGAIVNMVSGAQCGIELMTAYGASKGALAAMTYVWAIEAAGKGVRVNGVSPRGATRMGETHNAYLQARGRAPHGGPPPEANAPVVCFLLSDAAAAVHGQVVRIDDKSLSLMSHPAIAAPVFEAESWTPEALKAVFDARFAGAQFPLGVRAALVEPIDLASVKRRWPEG
ncbi:MAG: SDR family oxidoreductase [Caulobacteraceae bacterium]|nr:SDR family oxidoreductase [Caulobacteraceae bacterium]